MNTARRQQTAEAELRRVCARVPETTRASWSPREYLKEMLAANPGLGKWLSTASGAAGFWRRQRLIKLLPHGPLADTAPPSVPMHGAYVERSLDSAADALKREWLPITGELRPMRLLKQNLNICTTYQRNTISATKVDKIAASLDMVAFGALTVAQRGEEFYIVDGQNRWMASQRRAELTELNCLVFNSEGVKHEARIFAAININRSGVHASDKYRALVTGDDPIAMQLDEALSALNIEVVPRSAKGANQLAAIAFVYQMAQRDMRRCEAVLCCVQDITPGAPIFGELIKALDYLDRRIEGGVENATLKTRMRKIGAHKLMDVIMKARSANSGNGQLGIAVLGEVNRGLTESKRILLQEI